MRPGPGEVLHFSEDPTITRFVPHVARTAAVTTPHVWAVDAERAPGYWFPRDCPRAMAWIVDTTSSEDRERILGPGGGTRVHVIEHAWVRRMVDAKVFAYRLPADRFRPVSASDPHAMVASEPVEPLGPPVPLGDLFVAHDEAGIQLRVVSNLWAFWDAAVSSTMGYSGIRLPNARPRPPATSQ